MIDFDDAILTAYTVVARFHASLAQAEAGKLRVAESYSYHSDLSRHITQTQQASVKDHSNDQKTVLDYLMNHEHSYEQKKASLFLSLDVLEKQVHIFTLGSSNKAYSKSSFSSDTNTLKKLLHFSNTHASKIEKFHQQMQQELLSPLVLLGEDPQPPSMETQSPRPLSPSRFGKKV